MSRTEQNQIPPPEDSLCGYPGAWGREVVDMENHRLYWQATNDIMANAVDSHTETLTEAIEKLDKFIPFAGHATTTKMLDIFSMPEWLRQESQATSGPKAMVNRLQADPVIATNVMQWHNWNLSQKQLTFEAQKLPLLKQQFMASLLQAVQAGWVPDYVLGRVSILDDMPTYIDDGMELALDKAWANITTHRMLLHPNDQHEYATYAHEAGHALAGRGASLSGERAVDSLGVILRSDEGLMSTVLSEAITERLATGLTTGDIDTVVPSHRKLCYIPEQELLETLCSAGVHPIDIRVFIEAYFEDDFTEWSLGYDSATAKLMDALESAFPGIDIVLQLVELEGKDSIPRLLSQLLPDRTETKEDLESLPVLESPAKGDLVGVLQVDANG